MIENGGKIEKLEYRKYFDFPLYFVGSKKVNGWKK